MGISQACYVWSDDFSWNCDPLIILVSINPVSLFSTNSQQLLVAFQQTSVEPSVSRTSHIPSMLCLDDFPRVIILWCDSLGFAPSPPVCKMLYIAVTIQTPKPYTILFLTRHIHLPLHVPGISWGYALLLIAHKRFDISETVQITNLKSQLLLLQMITLKLDSLPYGFANSRIMLCTAAE